MWILIGAIVTASLMGSLHCVGMCGPLALWAAGADRSRKGSSMLIPTALYHFGRLMTYTVAGVVAGTIGQLLDWSGSALGFQLLAARVVGSLMVLLGLLAIYRIAWPSFRGWLRAVDLFSRRALAPVEGEQTGASALRLIVHFANRIKSTVRLNGRNHVLASGDERPGYQGPDYQGSGDPVPAPQPTWLSAQLIRLRPKLFKLPLPVRGLATGLLTALLPCGWLYLFALLAAGTGSALVGAIVMAAFWLGSVPALVSLVAGARLLSAPMRQAMPVLTSLMLIVAGSYTATGRGFADLSHQLSASSSLIDHLQSGQSLDQLDAKSIEAGMEQLVSTPLPCCQPENRGDEPPPP